MEKINHPSHYNINKIEVIDAIEDWQLNFSRGNAIKYIVRAGIKDPSTEIEDLKKAIWYLNREVERLNASKDLSKNWMSEEEIDDILGDKYTRIIINKS